MIQELCNDFIKEGEGKRKTRMGKLMSRRCVVEEEEEEKQSRRRIESEEKRREEGKKVSAGREGR